MYIFFSCHLVFIVQKIIANNFFFVTREPKHKYLFSNLQTLSCNNSNFTLNCMISFNLIVITSIASLSTGVCEC